MSVVLDVVMLQTFKIHFYALWIFTDLVFSRHWFSYTYFQMP